MYKNILIVAILTIVVGGIYVFQTLKKEKAITVPLQNKIAELSVAYFAGGCFWSVESVLEKLNGVAEVISGYMGGEEENASYAEVRSGKTGHRETVKVFL